MASSGGVAEDEAVKTFIQLKRKVVLSRNAFSQVRARMMSYIITERAHELCLAQLFTRVGTFGFEHDWVGHTALHMHVDCKSPLPPLSPPAVAGLQVVVAIQQVEHVVLLLLLPIASLGPRT